MTQSPMTQQSDEQTRRTGHHLWFALGQTKATPTGVVRSQKCHPHWQFIARPHGSSALARGQSAVTARVHVKTGDSPDVRDAAILAGIGQGLATLFPDSVPTVVLGTESRGSL